MSLQLNLYCFPQDVYDLLGTEGGQLRLDDHHLASAQVITVTASANANDTVLSTTALQWPLLNGTVLEFDGGGTAAVVEVITAATAARGFTQLTTVPLTAAINQYAWAYDSGVNLATAQRLIKACQYGTTQVKLYCASRYDDADLLLNAGEHGSVNRWSTNLAARWLCTRRSQPVPKGLAELVKETLDELKWVRTGSLQIEDIGTRTAGWPFFSNVSLDIGYDYRKLRVEAPLSEATPVQYPQSVDWNSALWVEL
jgi:hypothetical protein